MINRKLAEIALPIPRNAIMHDWWIGLVASQFGKISFVDEPTILYRQHNSNDTGAKKYNYKNILKKAIQFFSSDDLYLTLKKNIEQSKAFLESYRDKLDPQTIKMLEEFIEIQNRSFFQKRKILVEHKLLKYGLIRNIGLFLRI
ncbi:MAG: hypothetical protein K0U38_05810 [Epsilonproteobacteria bacterium]|nr:hypothetical protein [Campylobacterota bacterium]